MTTQDLIKQLLDHEAKEPHRESPLWRAWWSERNKLLEWIGRKPDGAELLAAAYRAAPDPTGGAA